MAFHVLIHVPFRIIHYFVILCDRECTRGGFCNFMHLKPISRELRRKLYGRQKKYVPLFSFYCAMLRRAR